MQTFRSAFSELSELQKSAPHEVGDLAAVCAAHIRSAWPLALTRALELEQIESASIPVSIDDIPTGPYHVANVSKDRVCSMLNGGAWYELTLTKQGVSLHVEDSDERSITVHLSDAQFDALIEDVNRIRVARGMR